LGYITYFIFRLRRTNVAPDSRCRLVITRRTARRWTWRYVPKNE